MLEILEYIFSSFWIFCGTIILIYTSGLSIAMVCGAIFGNGTNISLISKTYSGREGKENELSRTAGKGVG